MKWLHLSSCDYSCQVSPLFAKTPSLPDTPRQGRRYHCRNRRQNGDEGDLQNGQGSPLFSICSCPSQGVCGSVDLHKRHRASCFVSVFAGGTRWWISRRPIRRLGPKFEVHFPAVLEHIAPLDPTPVPLFAVDLEALYLVRVVGSSGTSHPEVSSISKRDVEI